MHSLYSDRHVNVQTLQHHIAATVEVKIPEPRIFECEPADLHVPAILNEHETRPKHLEIRTLGILFSTLPESGPERRAVSIKRAQAADPQMIHAIRIDQCG